MKLDTYKKTNTNTIITQAYHSRCSSWKLSSKAKIASDFSIKQGENENESMPSEIGFPTLTSDVFSTKNPINKLAMSNRRLLIAAEFHLYIQWKKTVKNITQKKKLSASAVKVNKLQEAA